MTGYGRARATRNLRDITVEVRSVNNRYLDCTVKMSRMYAFAEAAVKGRVQKAVSRGKVDVFITVDATAADTVQVSVNTALAAQYAEALKALGISDVDNLAGYRNVLPLFYSVTDKHLSEDKKVKDFMVKNPLTVFKKTNLSEVAKVMIANDFGQIPVHGTKDELVGMIYDVDVLCALSGNTDE